MRPRQAESESPPLRAEALLERRERVARLLAMAVPAVLVVECQADGVDNYLYASIAACVHLALAAVAVTTYRPGPTFWRTLAPLFGGLAAMLVWLMLGEIVGGPAHIRSGAFHPEFLTRLGLVGCFFLGTLMGQRSRDLYATCLAFTALGAAWTLVNLIDYGLDPAAAVTLANPLGRFDASLHNPNVAGCAFGMIATLAFANATGILLANTRELGPRRDGLIISLGGLAASLTALVCTGSRTAIVASLVAMTILFLRDRSSFALAGGQRPVAWLLLLLLGGGALALVLMQITAGLARDRFVALLGDADQRMANIAHFQQLAMEAPLFGYGLGSFRQINEAALDAGNVAHLWNFAAAHNLLVHAALQSGWVYVLLGLFAAGACLRRVIKRAAVRRLDRTESGLLAAIGIAVACGMVDIALNFAAIAALAAWFTGLVVGRAVTVRPEAARSRHSGRAVGSR